MKFKVKTGFSETDFIRIDENEVPKAIRAQGMGGVAVFTEGSISGNHIISVTPDWHYELGLNPGAKFESQDWKQIENMREKARDVLVLASGKADIKLIGNK